MKTISIPITRTGLALIFLASMLHSTGLAQEELDSWNGEALATIAGQVAPSIVRIESFGGSASANPAIGQPGTGTALGPDGHVVTAAFNLAHKPVAIIVRTSDGQRVNASIVGHNESRQLVMLRLETDQPPPPLALTQSVRAGQTAIALGKALDPETPGLSSGIVSATGRLRGRALQTDAAVSPNNYGGPLVDLDGNVLGILVPMSPRSDQTGAGLEWYDSGIGFAVSVTDEDLQRMAAGETLQAGLLGVSWREDNGFASQPVIATVAPNSPAQKNGLQQGDRIRAIDDVPVELLTQVRQLIGPRYAGDPVELAIERDGEKELLKRDLVLTDRIEPWQPAMLGVLGNSNTGNADGIEARYVLPASPADRAGLQATDLITAINGQPVAGRNELMEALAVLPAGTDIELEILRQQAPRTLHATLAVLAAEPWANEPAPSSSNAPQPAPIRITIPDDPIASWAWIPPTDRKKISGLLVWLGPPGELDPDQELLRWREACNQFGMACLLIPSTRADAWQPDEASRINKAVKQVLTDFELDPKRVAIAGSESAGQLASITALQSPALYRGLILVDSGPDRRVQDTETKPLQRQMIMLLQTNSPPPAGSAVDDVSAALQGNGFPIWQQSIAPPDLPQLVIRWLDSLDRF